MYQLIHGIIEEGGGGLGGTNRRSRVSSFGVLFSSCFVGLADFIKFKEKV